MSNILRVSVWTNLPLAALALWRSGDTCSCRGQATLGWQWCWHDWQPLRKRRDTLLPQPCTPVVSGPSPAVIRGVLTPACPPTQWPSFPSNWPWQQGIWVLTWQLEVRSRLVKPALLRKQTHIKGTLQLNCDSYFCQVPLPTTTV